MIERVCVVGAGVIGSLYAGHLARVADVWVLTRRTEHATALEERGLRVSGRNEFAARVSATANPAERLHEARDSHRPRAVELARAGPTYPRRVPIAYPSRA